MRTDRVYGVQMRSTSDPGRDTWAAYATASREAAGLNKSALARRLDVDRATVSRWETGATRPDSAETVVAFADLFGLDRDEALSAAGFRPGTTDAPARPAPLDPREDPVIRAILDDPRWSDDQREELVRMQLERIAQDLARRRAEYDWLARQENRGTA
jgi:transcriptional regulator with XRE-family HTH domain